MYEATTLDDQCRLPAFINDSLLISRVNVTRNLPSIHMGPPTPEPGRQHLVRALRHRHRRNVFSTPSGNVLLSDTLSSERAAPLLARFRKDERPGSLRRVDRFVYTIISRSLRESATRYIGSEINITFSKPREALYGAGKRAGAAGRTFKTGVG
jgi:hypothetical protein